MADPHHPTPAAEAAGDEGWIDRFLRPFRHARAWVRRVPGGWVAWRVAVAILGGIVIALGIVLLPLPGPGWLIIFGGIALWATEFAWAERLLVWTMRQVREYSARIKSWWVRRRGADV
jgi:uncharacterized protein (TIGR02611 family)